MLLRIRALTCPVLTPGPDRPGPDSLVLTGPVLTSLVLTGPGRVMWDSPYLTGPTH